MRALLLILAIAPVYAQPQTDSLKRTIGDSAPSRKAPQRTAEPPARDPGSSSFDALISSTENLNAIRDRNVQRLKECSPDVAARIGEIRERLGIKTGSQKKDANTEASLLAISAGWFKAPQENLRQAASRPQNDLIDSVLPRSEKNPEADAAALRVELDRLVASCSGGKK